MTTNIKSYIGRKIAKSLKSPHISLDSLRPLLSTHNRPNRSNDSEGIEVSVAITDVVCNLNIPNPNDMLTMPTDDVIRGVRTDTVGAREYICFNIDRKRYITEILNEQNCELQTSCDLKNQRKIVVEYSSPNVAKPFHVGHLRSTIIGNFIANIHKYFADSVTRINYLGDWGTQFGFVKVGLEELHYTMADLRTNPLQKLYKSYVHANKLGDRDCSIAERARSEFARLEMGSVSELGDWESILKVSIEELQQMYQRLGIEFDVYDYESMYRASRTVPLLDQLRQAGILSTNNEGLHVAQLGSTTATVPLQKSDGTTLYLTRDIAAALDRQDRYGYDHMYYVVDQSQRGHFVSLKALLSALGHLQCADKLTHVPFGRVRGMSSRKGQVVFLADMLDEMAEVMHRKQVESPTTKAPISDTAITDTLAVSCVIVNDLKQRRQKNYDLDFKTALDTKGDSGAKLQYTHCRLCSLEEQNALVPAIECDASLLLEPEVTALVREIGRFDDVLRLAANELEACLLVVYLFNLCNHINRALKVLRVKDADHAVGAQRLLLFCRARRILHQGMSILGLKPLTRM